jgi:molybdopterin/thiamine biosynthesis adenylyltransferase
VILITDLAVAEIDSQLTCWQPERGGALMGPIGIDAVSRFVFDEDARTTRVTYQPSTRLGELVRQLELDAALRYLGVAHSHPGRLDSPSEPDRYELGVGLERNPHMAEYLAPIVTTNAGPAASAHEVDTEHGKISFYAATRPYGDGPEVDIDEAPVRVVPVGATLERAAVVLGLDEVPDARELSLDGVPLMAAGGHDAAGAEWSFLLPWHLDVATPVVLRDGVAVPVSWDLRYAADDRLARGLERALEADRARARTAPAPSTTPWWARHAGVAVTVLGAAAARGWAAVRRTAVVAQGARLERIESILPPRHAAGRRVLIAGLGSVGSRMAEELARTGVGKLTLVDPDTVTPANLSRSSYLVRDVGMPKVDALARLLMAAAPDIAIRRRALRVDAAAEDWLRGAIARADLVVAATDDPEAQLIMNRLAAEAGVPSLYIGLTTGAHGGEVLLVSPDRTPCYACALAMRQAQPPELRQEVDYGAARLDGEPALGCDIAHVTTAAARLALSLVAPRDSELAEFAERAIANGTTYLTMGMTTEYWFFPALFDSTRAQYAFQSAWLTPTRRPDCPICGEAPEHDAGDDEPSLTALRAIALRDQNHHPTEEVSP